jgi:nitrous oxidase accessory protein NosD
MKKWLIFGITLLLVGTCIISATAQDTEKPLPTSRGKWLYVGGSGPGNYTKIQDAVDNASNGDTVFVYSGEYTDYSLYNHACVEITKSIYILGEDREQTIINGPGDSWIQAIHIDSNNVVVSGFTLQNSGSSENDKIGYGIFICPYITDIFIYDNIIQENYYGVSISIYCSVYIYNNTFTMNSKAIEGLDYSIGEIFNNTITKNDKGIRVSSNDYHVYNNQITNNSIGIEIGYVTSNIIVEHNHIQNNNIGIQINNGVTKIKENNFIENKKHIDLNIVTSLLFISPFFSCRQTWSNNFWDDWIFAQPRPIKGEWKIYINIRFFLHEYSFQIAKLLYTEYDKNPTQEPYDIP